jgi:hypothetical protein
MLWFGVLVDVVVCSELKWSGWSEVKWSGVK